jgi:hypothetical protein
MQWHCDPLSALILVWYWRRPVSLIRPIYLLASVSTVSNLLNCWLYIERVYKIYCQGELCLPTSWPISWTVTPDSRTVQD